MYLCRSAECKAAFPKKQAEVEVEKTPEMKKKADARRRYDHMSALSDT